MIESTNVSPIQNKCRLDASHAFWSLFCFCLFISYSPWLCYFYLTSIRVSSFAIINPIYISKREVLFMEGWILSSQSELVESFLNCSNLLEKSLPFQKATSV